MIKRYIIALLTLLTFSAGSYAADTAQETLDKCVAKLRTASGISADFTITRQGRNMTGKIKEKGSKFSIITPAVASWYDGRTLTTWVADNNEATVVTPSQDELNDSNPLMLLQSAAGYSVSFGTSNSKTQKTLVLTPKKRGMSAKKIVVTLASASLIPQRIDVTLTDGKVMSITLRNVSLKSQIADSEFQFNKAKYPKAKIVDLRS